MRRDTGHTAAVLSYGRGKVRAECSGCGWKGDTFEADDYGLAWKQGRKHEREERSKER
jgi:hypothetical protein